MWQRARFVLLALAASLVACSRDAPLSYCVDSKALDIFVGRITACMYSYGGSPSGTGSDSIAAQLHLLRSRSAYEYFKSNELLAFDFFVNTPNPFKVAECADAEFEYVPMMPLHWAVEMASSSTNPMCTYRGLIRDIVAYVDYKRGLKSKHTPQPFVVTSTFNLRTEMAAGLQMQARRGPEWEKVSAFVMAANIANYERLHECPDTLRKQWRFIVETATLPAASLLSDTGDPLAARDAFLDGPRPTAFHFSGRFAGDLYGPERFCSVRVALANIDSRCLRGSSGEPLRIAFDNTTLAYSRSSISQHLVERMRSSVYCIVAKSNSYSSAFFYGALHAGCVPVIVSDWFSFAHPSLLDYSRFVIRIAEEDFLKCAACALRRLAALHSDQQLRAKREAMLQALPLLSYLPFPASGPLVRAAISSLHHNVLNSSKGSCAEQKYAYLLRQLAGSRPDHKVSFPLLLAMLEMRHFADMDGYRDRYFRCFAPHSCSYGDAVPQVRALHFSPSLPDQRPHLCKHVARLIGYYKIVYFMQCVRIMWPLKPADNFRPGDLSRLRTANASGPTAGRETSLPEAPGCDAALATHGLTAQELHIVKAFHQRIEEVAYMSPSMDSSYVYPALQRGS